MLRVLVLIYSSRSRTWSHYITFLSFMAHCWDSISVQNYSHSWDCNSTVDKYISLWVWVPTQKQKSPSLDLRSQMKCQQVICVCFYVEWDRECACVRACVWKSESEWVICFACMYMHYMYAVLKKPEEGVGSPETGVTDRGDLPY